MSIQNNLIDGSYKNGVKNLIFLGSSCVYPRNCKQPIKEHYLLSGKLEQTNDAYAIAKIAGIKMCEAYRKQYGCDFISAQPNNLYGPSDNFDIKRAGTGNSDLADLKEEFNDRPHDRGTLSMARTSDPNSANSQFFICFKASPFLDRQYTVFGKVIKGMEFVDLIKRGEGSNGEVKNPDKIISLTAN